MRWKPTSKVALMLATVSLPSVTYTATSQPSERWCIGSVWGTKIGLSSSATRLTAVRMRPGLWPTFAMTHGC